MASVPDIMELHTGDRMTRREFHRIYERMPAHFKAELIGGIVYVAFPLKRPHGTNHLPLGSLFFAYESHTPGVESGDNTTILLGEESEPQPDLYLRPAGRSISTALLARDHARMMEALQQGLASPDHDAFVRTLADKAASS